MKKYILPAFTIIYVALFWYLLFIQKINQYNYAVVNTLAIILFAITLFNTRKNTKNKKQNGCIQVQVLVKLCECSISNDLY